MTASDAFALFGRAFVAGLAVGAACGLLSPLVVLRRLSFVGQGVSHAAFGGIGIALLLGFASVGTFGVVAGFCVLAALAIAWLSDRKGASADTVIGIVLVASMALGAILVSLRYRMPGAGAGGAPPWEDLLFGSLMSVGAPDAAAAWAVALAVAAALLVVRRPMLFYAFDTPSAEAFGVRVGLMKALLMVMLAVTIVTAMKLAGVVLATALLVLPGAAALKLSERLGQVLLLSLGAAVLGVVGGLGLSLGLDLPPGACVVAALVAIYGASMAVAPVVRPRARGGAAAPAATIGAKGAA